MNNNFHKIIKAVGTGVKHNHNLTINEMQEAMDMILKKDVYPEQLSAFLLGWRMKPETADEFKGVLNSFDTFIKKTTINNSIEIGYPYDGKVNNPYLFPLIAKYLQKFDLNIIVSGDKLQPAKNGITTKEICNNIKLEKNLFYFNRKNYFKELSELTTIRNRLGLRTGINSIERLLNPANSKMALLGVFHKPFIQKYIEIFSNRYERLVIIKGNEGTPEIFSKCKYWLVQNGTLQEYTINPEDFGINYKKSWDKITLKESLDLINNPSFELSNIAKLNAAIILFSYGKAKSIENGYNSLK